jgi:hypothetical protein
MNRYWMIARASSREQGEDFRERLALHQPGRTWAKSWTKVRPSLKLFFTGRLPVWPKAQDAKLVWYIGERLYKQY